MGNSQSSSSSCSSLCSDDSVMQKEVIVMKEDGESMKFKQGTRVYDILAAHPFHKVIRCCSARTVLPEDFCLNAKSLYFLLPQGLSVCDATYRSLIKCAVSKELVLPKAAVKVNPPRVNIMSSSDHDRIIIREKDDDDDDADDVVLKWNKKYSSSSQWTPGLKTIPEVISPSPPLHDHHA